MNLKKLLTRGLLITGKQKRLRLSSSRPSPLSSFSRRVGCAQAFAVDGQP
jgi:hypothetical protein